MNRDDAEALSVQTTSRIKDRCPSCGHDTLFIGGNGWLTCSWLECKQPAMHRAILEAVQITVEKCAKVCDNFELASALLGHADVQDVSKHLGAAIRATQSKEG